MASKRGQGHVTGSSRDPSQEGEGGEEGALRDRTRSPEALTLGRPSVIIEPVHTVWGPCQLQPGHAFHPLKQARLCPGPLCQLWHLRPCSAPMISSDGHRHGLLHFSTGLHLH